MILNLNSISVNQTREIGLKIGFSLTGGELILLSGDLGMGKTLLTKGIAKGINIPEEEIVSPTFTLQNRYFSKKLNTYLCHFDLYRIGDNTDERSGLISPEIDEALDEGIIVVEWAQYLHRSYFSIQNTIMIDITIPCSNTEERSIKIKANNKNINGLEKFHKMLQQNIFLKH